MLLTNCMQKSHIKMESCWILFSLISLTLFSSQVSAAYNFPDERQAEFVQSLKDYHITTPEKVTENGQFVSRNLHHDLRKRDAEQHVHYHVEVDGRKMHLSLKPNHKLIAPGMVIERKNSRYGNVTDSRIVKKGFNTCHFVGEIKGEEDSKVAISTCNGLNGVLMTRDGHYFIEPVKGHNGTSDQHQPHLVYKHEHLPDQHHHRHGHEEEKEEDEDDKVCGSNGSHTDEDTKREEWERHVRRNYGNHHRHKRSISLERKVETLVVVDPKMVHYYKDEDIETYVLTIMNMVATMYHDASIGNAVNIALVRLMLLEEDEKDLLISHHADNTLKSFCTWQKNINPKDDSHPNHHDVAVLLTRYNICSRMNQPCSTLGLAQVSGMCQPHRSCNVNEDTGLALAYTVAHELGHNFGMKHDSYINGCMVRDGDRRYVMSPQLHVDTSPLIWSNCSRAEITKFLDRDWGYCLEDEPAEHDFEFPVLPPGVMYDADHQCRLQYGPDAEFCDGIESICKTLWCRVDNKCMTRVEAAAEGTLCEQQDYFNIVQFAHTPKKWCFAGECVTIGDRPESINGEWSQWGSWSGCSRSCGAGVTYAERLCDNPPPSNGGKYCLGERKRFRICDTDPCPEGFPSFHDTQCQEFNYIPYKNGMYEWEHVPTLDTPCQLHCKPINRFFHVMLKDIVTDGTPCMPGTRNMCISGRCRHVGCDWVIESDAKEDRCGVCHGDGRACKTVKDQFKAQQGLGYVEATIIPTGARNIRIEEVAEANNYIALRNDRGEYLLNGHWFIQWSGDYDAAGSKVHYERNGNKEKLFALGPIKEPLHVMLLFQSHNPGVTFEYTVPNENATETRQPVFDWKYSEWTHCTSSCGGGTQQSIVVCTEQEAGVIDNGYCLLQNMTKPDDKLRSCNTHLCPARWWAGPWQHCSVTCGLNGIHKRTVICVRSFGPDHQIALEDHECEDQEKPKEYELCHHKDPCPDEVYWEAGRWSECTRSCGGGIQFRDVTCVGDVTCPRVEKPGSERICNLFDCDELTTTGSSTSGTASVNTTMMPSPVGNTTDGALTEEDKAVIRKIMGDDYVYDGDDEDDVDDGDDVDDHDDDAWSPEQGKAMVIPTTREAADSGFAYSTVSGPVVTPSAILPSGSKEETTEGIETNGDKALSKKASASSGTAHSWSPEDGDAMADGQETAVNGPAHEVDNEWSPKNGDALEGAEDAGGGKWLRFDLDIKEGGETIAVNPPLVGSNPLGHSIAQKLSPDLPTLSPKETTTEATALPENVVHNVPASQSQPISNEKDVSKDAANNMADLPSNTTATADGNSHVTDLHDEATSVGTPASSPSYQWLPLFWQACSKQCGGGVMQRKLMCMSKKTLHEVTPVNCQNIPRLVTEKRCNDQPCVGWQATSWSECSKSCGNGTQYRQVACPVEKMCNQHDRPKAQQFCNTHRCIGWIAGPWSKCSRTCSGGEQARHVQCIDLVTDQPATGCDSLRRPEESQTCNTALCEVENAALQDRFAKAHDDSEKCDVDKMRRSICVQLKRKGQCAHRYIAMQCCRTCMQHRKRGKGQNTSRR